MNQTVDQRSLADGSVPDEDQLGLVQRLPTATYLKIIFEHPRSIRIGR